MAGFDGSRVADIIRECPADFTGIRTVEKMKVIRVCVAWCLFQAKCELNSVRRRLTKTKLRQPVEASGGSMMRLTDNEGHAVADINQLPLLPGILVALAFPMAIGSAWWREGR